MDEAEAEKKFYDLFVRLNFVEQEIARFRGVFKHVESQNVGLHNRIVDLETDRDEQDRRVTNLETSRRIG